MQTTWSAHTGNDYHKVQLLQRTCTNGGGGLPRQKLDNVQVALRNIDILLPSLSCSSRGCRAFLDSTRSLHWCESPAMFPRAHTACAISQGVTRVGNLASHSACLSSLTCSLTSSLGERRSCTKSGTAPLSITSRVLSEVPDATLVRAQAASNCSTSST